MIDTQHALAIGQAAATANIEVLHKTDDNGVWTHTAICTAETTEDLSVKVVFDIDDDGEINLDHAEVGNIWESLWDSRFANSFTRYDAEDIECAFADKIKSMWRP